MDPVSLALTSIDLCFRYGSLLVQAFNTWKQFGPDVAERTTIYENAWMKTRDQVLFVQRISHTLDDEHRRVLDDTLGILAGKLSLVAAKVEGIQVAHGTKKDEKWGLSLAAEKIRKAKYVLIKSTLDEIIRDMEDWQRRFDPSWYLIFLMPNSLVDKALEERAQNTTTALLERTSIGGTESQVLGHRISQSSESAKTSSGSGQSPLDTAEGVRDALRPNPHRHVSVFLPEQDLDVVSIPYANAMLARRKGSSSSKWLIINSIHCTPSSNMTAMTKDIRDLARKLTQADPSRFGLLQCKGVMRVMRPPMPRSPTRWAASSSAPELQSFDMVFRSPDGSSACRSLREALLNPVNVSLSYRIHIAQQLAKSVNYVHAFNFVHKNIRPESFLVWDGMGSKLPSTFLVGFDKVRSADGGTNLLGDDEWAANMYRHPSRQGERLVQSHKMQHDIYSLGVCLLEIGLWDPLVQYTTEEGAAPFLPIHDIPQRGTVLDDYMEVNESNIVPGREDACLLLSGEPFKKYLVTLANAELPALVGDRFTEIVVACLTCLDPDNDGFGDESEMLDEDGILVGVRFIETILLRLNEIVV
ncbi:hypothetical protein E8E14_009718 [Neopestalotiopsis sp. 37M]|nr:hypothetical protein E8E14_009718 [Neopestalotiopsis sp. 37M]